MPIVNKSIFCIWPWILKGKQMVYWEKEKKKNDLNRSNVKRLRFVECLYM